MKNKNEITTWPPLGFRKVKLSGNCIIVTCPLMILSLNGFDDSRIAVDYSRLNFLDCEKTKSQKCTKSVH